VLSYVGLELETMERMIARIWTTYEGNSKEVTVIYPKQYSIKSDDEKLEEAEKLKKLQHDAPSMLYKKEIAKQIAKVTLGHKVTSTILKKILSEIDAAEILDVTPDILAKDVEIGLVSAEDASLARGYPDGSVKKAQKEHADRLARISKSQEDGNGDTTVNPNAGKESKEAVGGDTDPDLGDKTRGKENKVD